MASPNFSEYIDLTLYDVDAYDVYNDAVEYAKTAVPEFSPRAGTLEEAIMQAMAFNTALLSSQINRLPDGLMEGMARLSGLERLEATFATGSAEFTVFDNNGTTIPGGTVVAYEVVADGTITSYQFQTDSDLTIPSGSTTGIVSITAIYAGRYPAILAGQTLTLVSPAPTVMAVELATAIYVGTDSETDSDFFNRGVQHFASLSSCLTTKAQVSNYIKSKYPNIGSFGVFDLTKSTADSGTMSWSGSAEPGYVTIVACDTSGAALTSTASDALIADIASKTVAGLTVKYRAPVAISITVDVDIVVASGYSSSSVQAAVDAMLTAKLSPLGYKFNKTIIKNELISLIAAVPGVAYVSSLTMTSATTGSLAPDASGNLVFVYKYGVPNASVSVSSV